MMKRAAFLLLLVVPCFGFTTCQYFHQVPVSTSESTPPIVGARMWVDGYESIRTGDSYTHTTTGSVAVYPFVFDSGGAWMINLEQRVDIYCHDYDADPEEGQITTIYYFDKFESQAAASAGQMRSDGIYLIGDVSDLMSFDWYCYDGFDLESVTYTWTVWGRDYSWNEAEATGTIVWP